MASLVKADWPGSYEHALDMWKLYVYGCCKYIQMNFGILFWLYNLYIASGVKANSQPWRFNF